MYDISAKTTLAFVCETIYFEISQNESSVLKKFHGFYRTDILPNNRNIHTRVMFPCLIHSLPEVHLKLVHTTLNVIWIWIQIEFDFYCVWPHCTTDFFFKFSFPSFTLSSFKILTPMIQKKLHFFILSSILSRLMPLWNLLGPVRDMYCSSHTYRMLVTGCNSND